MSSSLITMPGITSKSSPGCYVTTSTGYIGAPVEAGDRGQPMPGVVCGSSGVVHILGWVLISAAGIQCCQKISSGAPLCGHSVSWSRLPEGAMGMGHCTRVSVTGHRAAIASVTQARCHRTVSVWAGPTLNSHM